MKKKVLLSIVGIASFAVAIAFNSQRNETEDLTVKNIEALASGWAEGLHPGYGMTSYHCDCGIYVMMCVHYGSGCPISQQGVCALDCP